MTYMTGMSLLFHLGPGRLLHPSGTASRGETCTVESSAMVQGGSHGSC